MTRLGEICETLTRLLRKWLLVTLYNSKETWQ